MICIGVDLGMTGAIAALDHRSYQVIDIPITEEGVKRAQGRQFIVALRNFVQPGEPFTCVYEDIQVRKTHGRPMNYAAEGALSRARGALEAILDVMGCQDRHAIDPLAWKRHFGLLKKDKRASLEIARTLFPLQAHNLTRQLDSNRAEALLIGRYYIDKLQ